MKTKNKFYVYNSSIMANKNLKIKTNFLDIVDISSIFVQLIIPNYN